MQFESSLNQIVTSNLYKLLEDRTDPAPTIIVHLLSSSGTKNVEVLSDPGVDISAAGQELLGKLGSTLTIYYHPISVQG